MSYTRRRFVSCLPPHREERAPQGIIRSQWAHLFIVDVNSESAGAAVADEYALVFLWIFLTFIFHSPLLWYYREMMVRCRIENYTALAMQSRHTVFVQTHIYTRCIQYTALYLRIEVAGAILPTQYSSWASKGQGENKKDAYCSVVVHGSPLQLGSRGPLYTRSRQVGDVPRDLRDMDRITHLPKVVVRRRRCDGVVV
ncbi:hypothetical protein GGR55DRAFT_335798 [Xylaria sp. FL0064]|nr:hypothetical protein GGR55DRAFT_335798 [Xylaria sp. FL0064]